MRLLRNTIRFYAFVMFLVFSQFIGFSHNVWAENAKSSELEIMSSFNADEVERAKNSKVVEDSSKHKILFWMGIALLVLIIATASVGVNMAFFGKEVFVVHMVLAGGTVFLSLAHAVTAIVWFYPY